MRRRRQIRDKVSRANAAHHVARVNRFLWAIHLPRERFIFRYLGLLRKKRHRLLRALGPDSPFNSKQSVRIPPPDLHAVSLRDKFCLRPGWHHASTKHHCSPWGTHEIESWDLTTHDVGAVARVPGPSKWTGSSLQRARRARCLRALRRHQGVRSQLRAMCIGRLSRDEISARQKVFAQLWCSVKAICTEGTFRDDAIRDEGVHQHPDQGRSGFRAQGSRVLGLGFRVQGVGFTRAARTCPAEAPPGLGGSGRLQPLPCPGARP